MSTWLIILMLVAIAVITFILARSTTDRAVRSIVWVVFGLMVLFLAWLAVMALVVGPQMRSM